MHVTTKRMNSMDETCDGDDALRLQDEIHRQARSIGRTVTIMEVCGGHTSAIGRFGIAGILPGSVRLVSGPGCPVCATSGRDVDTALILAGRKNVIFSARSDMLAVPGSGGGTLRRLAAQGADAREAASARDAMETARNNPRREVVHMAIGFEDAAAEVASLVKDCREQGITNLSVFSLLKRITPAIAAILGDAGPAVDGVLCPGRAGAVIGMEGYAKIPELGRPAVVAGYAPGDILGGISMILAQIEEGRRAVENRCGVPMRPGGDPQKTGLIEEVFTRVPAEWRGLGVIPGSGLVFRDRFAPCNALARFDVPIMEPGDIMGCMCGAILRGAASPQECPLFGHACNTANPIGPGMISREGSCFTRYSYP